MLVIGATTAFFMGLLGIVNNDIKRVIAYSTLSQLGYMTVALGASAYSGAIFHLMTHAFFKALLFLAAGSVIIGMHHEQDMRKMGGLKKYMPITYWTALIGSLALIGVPGTSRLLLEGHPDRSGARVAPDRWRPYAYWCVLLGVFVTAFYSFRLVFMTFHGEERFATPDIARMPRHAAREPVGRHAAADPAGDSVARRSAGSRSGRCCSATTSATRSRVLPAHDVLGHVKEEFHGPARSCCTRSRRAPV